ncbi:taste receptor type 2 member 5 [Trichosurus vulpecula]|uniref:taste receptor type 2 member 5 n=1 Tax=Trichosurus vulpecula TaxID=9337 RepID=UPI00186ADADA|nr:taste receptor type 2 member 5 [Trichosurus vulpecula]
MLNRGNPECITWVWLLTGIVGNLLIVTVNCRIWIKSKNLSSFDMILSSLSMTRCICLSLMCLKIPNSVGSSKENMRNSTMVSTSGSFFFVMVPLGLSFSLRFVINLGSCSLLISSLRRHMQKMQKNASSFWNPQTEAHITNFVHPAFMWLKHRAMEFGFCFLLGSLLATLLIAPILERSSIPRNISTPYLLFGQHYIHMFWFNLGSFVPFIVFLLSSGMLIISLSRHHRRMLHHLEGRKDAQTKAHVAALKSLISFLLLYVMYFLATPFSIISKFPPGKLTEVLISEIFMAAYPSFHSAILIVGNPKMKQQFQRLMWKIVCLWRSQQM